MKYVICTAALTALAGSASADTLASWSYDGLVITTGTPAASYNAGAADSGVFAASSISSGTHASAASAWSTPVGNGSVKSFSANGFAVGDYWQFTSSTLGYSSLSFKFDAVSSNTGPRDMKISYSTNGSSFTDIGTYQNRANAAPAWSSGLGTGLDTFTFALPAGAENQANLYIRLSLTGTTSASGTTTVAATGTSRIDTVSLTGVTPTPGAASLMGFAGLVGLRRRR